MLTKELSIEKEKLHTLEAAFERLRKQGLYIFCIAAATVPFSVHMLTKLPVAVKCFNG